jgi:uncharacterized protein
MQHSPNDRSVAPASPCINVCVLGTNGYCLGCLRTGDEIARWREMSAGEQWTLIDRLAERQSHSEGQGRRAADSPPDGSSNES